MDAHEGLGAALAQIVNGPRQGVPARARLALDEHRRLGPGRLVGQANRPEPVIARGRVAPKATDLVHEELG